jgi:hypothetical protein
MRPVAGQPPKPSGQSVAPAFRTSIGSTWHTCSACMPAAIRCPGSADARATPRHRPPRRATSRRHRLGRHHRHLPGQLDRDWRPAITEWDARGYHKQSSLQKWLADQHLAGLTPAGPDSGWCDTFAVPRAGHGVSERPQPPRARAWPGSGRDPIAMMGAVEIVEVQEGA